MARAASFAFCCGGTRHQLAAALGDDERQDDVGGHHGALSIPAAVFHTAMPRKGGTRRVRGLLPGCGCPRVPRSRHRSEKRVTQRLQSFHRRVIADCRSSSPSLTVDAYGGGAGRQKTILRPSRIRNCRTSARLWRRAGGVGIVRQIVTPKVVVPRAVVAIPACNEEERVGACLAALAAQSRPSGRHTRDSAFPKQLH